MTIATAAGVKPREPKLPSAPRVWVVDAYREGERSQLRALAEALGWPYEVKCLVYRRYAWRVNLLRGSDLSGIDRARSDPLDPPWPDLVLAAGMRNEPVCRWIRDRSGGRTRIVHLGRPWADPDRFDLVITTPQYRLPVRANVLHNVLPLHGVDEARLAAAVRRHGARLSALPRPRLAVVVGGPSGPYAFGPKAARRLRRAAVERARALGGSLLVTTSARTPPAVAEALAAIAEVPVWFHRWRRDDPDNPYLAFLAAADELIVTADSVSMLAEACATGKPVWMFDLGVGRGSMSGRPRQPGEEGNDLSLKALAYRLLMRFGPRRLSRDLTLVHRALVAAGRAAWLGEAPPRRPAAAADDLERAVARVRALMGWPPP
ncbi:MAG: hypothetical protein KatS3mg124_0365 [Porticoccaceae bacterium]|nr:MAG: hypothetical protein KatS3mg124_0365 [Porticoccaceae bacterium]